MVLSTTGSNFGGNKGRHLDRESKFNSTLFKYLPLQSLCSEGGGGKKLLD